MNRRELLRSAAVPLLPAAAAVQNGQMKLGCQSRPTTDQRLQFFKRHGVEHICGYADELTAEGIAKLRDRCEKAGVTLAMIAPPFLASSHIDKTARPTIMLGQSPERDRDIEDFQNIIRNCARAGVPAVKYNMSILGVLRTERTPGRGGVSYSTWKLREAKASSKFAPLTRAGRITADRYWECIDYFLKRVVPVAAEHKIRIACHPHDPGVPPVEGFQGVDAVLGTVDGLKKFIAMHENPYHGLNFCQGTVSEMLQDPGNEIYDVIRHFGRRKKIFNVHFRNIRGHRDDFVEVYPDEGDVNFFKAAQAYKEVGYDGMLMPDHVPHHPDDPGGLQAFAFSYGYIRAVLQAVNGASKS